MSAETAALLRAAREKIAVPERWTRNEFARDYTQQKVKINSPNACCWCSYGAIITVAKNFESENAAADALKKQVPDGFIFKYNDARTTTHADVLACFDRAIAAEEATP